MLEKLAKGRYLNFDMTVPKLTYELESFVTQPKMSLTLTQSVKEKVSVKPYDVTQNMLDGSRTVAQKQRVSSFNAGEAQKKIHRNFQWLYYYGGAVNEVSYDNIDVLSGNFSGCWMMVYRKNGIQYVGHVGTVDDPTTKHSIAAKKAWNKFASENKNDVIRGFSPAKAWPPEDVPDKIDGDGLARIWGLVTTDRLVSVYLYRGDKDWNRYRIADVKDDIPTAHKSTLCALP